MTLLDLLKKEEGTFYLYFEDLCFDNIIGSNKLLLISLNYSIYSREVKSWQRNYLDQTIINVIL